MLLKRILAIDDNVDNLDLIEGFLEDEGCTVMRAISGPQALELACTIVPDVILLDLMMPDMDGFAVYEALQGDDCLCRVPIILITAYSGHDNVLHAAKLGFKHVLSKPVGRQRLISEIAKCAGGPETATKSSREPAMGSARPPAKPNSGDAAEQVVQGVLLENRVETAASVADIGELIQQEAELGQRLIRLANSVERSGRRRVTTVPAAIIRLGINRTKDLVRKSFAHSDQDGRVADALVSFIDSLMRNVAGSADPERVLLEQLERLGTAASLLRKPQTRETP